MIPNRFLVAFLPLLLCAAPGSAEPLKIGYWTSGYSLGFGAVLEAGKFLEKEGVEVRYVKFGDVGAPARAPDGRCRYRICGAGRSRVQFGTAGRARFGDSRHAGLGG